MHSRCAIAALLIVILAASAAGCVAGWVSHDPCAPDLCVRRTASCDAAVQAAPGHCGMRTFVQFHFVSFHRFELAAPMRAAEAIPAPRPRTIVLTSIGSPETDRGPPNS